MDPEPSNPEKPASFPKIPLIEAISVKAPPIPDKPLPILFQERDPIFFKAFAILLRLFTTVTILADPNKPENPASFPRAPLTIATSDKAPPIADKPRPISLQDICPNFKSALAISSND